MFKGVMKMRRSSPVVRTYSQKPPILVSVRVQLSKACSEEDITRASTLYWIPPSKAANCVLKYGDHGLEDMNI